MDRREVLKKVTLLSGGVLPLSIASGVLSSCRSHGDVDWSPIFLTGPKAKLVSEIADIILPSSTTPGAIDLHVPEFIDLMLHDCLTREEQDAFLGGLEEWQVRFKNEYNRDFLAADLQQRRDFVEAIDLAAYVDSQTFFTFYRKMKQLVLLGYFTSEPIMTNHLNYQAIPGRYDGCIPYDQAGAYVDNNVEGRL